MICGTCASRTSTKRPVSNRARATGRWRPRCRSSDSPLSWTSFQDAPRRVTRRKLLIRGPFLNNLERTPPYTRVYGIRIAATHGVRRFGHGVPACAMWKPVACHLWFPHPSRQNLGAVFCHLFAETPLNRSSRFAEHCTQTATYKFARTARNIHPALTGIRSGATEADDVRSWDG